MRANRRTFLGWCIGAVSSLGSSLLALVGCGPARRRAAIPPGRRATLEAAVDRILPGAREAGAARYIEGALEHPFFKTLRGPMAEGLDLLEALARSFYARGFAESDESQQDAVLAHVQSGAADTPGFSASRFFERLTILTLEGYLGDPVHGGNRDCVGWRFIGYEPGAPQPGSCGKGGHDHR